MTKQEFEEGSFSINELYEMCNDAECWEPFEELYSADSVDDMINETLADVWDNLRSWKDLRDELNNVDLDGDWYITDDYSFFGYTCVDDDEYFIDDLKSRVEEALSDIEWFDEDEIGDIDEIEPLELSFDEDERDNEITVAEPEWFESAEVDLMQLF